MKIQILGLHDPIHILGPTVTNHEISCEYRTFFGNIYILESISAKVLCLHHQMQH